jgi:hypothetical protein
VPGPNCWPGIGTFLSSGNHPCFFTGEKNVQVLVF